MKNNFFELAFMVIAIIFNLLIAAIWITSKKKRFELVRKFGIILLGLSIPLAAIFVDFLLEGRDFRIILYFVFIFIYMLVELLFDFILKIEFRKKPVLHVPYIILFYLATFAFIAISFSFSKIGGYFVSISFWVALAGLVYLLWGRKKGKEN